MKTCRIREKKINEKKSFLSNNISHHSVVFYIVSPIMSRTKSMDNWIPSVCEI